MAEQAPKGGREQKSMRGSERHRRRMDQAVERMGGGDGFSVPVFEQNLTVRSVQAQRVVAQVLAETARGFFVLDVILRIIGNPQEVGTVMETINKKLEDASAQLNDELARIRTLCENNAIDEMPKYKGAYTTTVAVSTPQLSEFLALLRILDDIVCWVDALWLKRVLSSEHRAAVEEQWQQRLVKLGRHVISVRSRAYRAAMQKGKGDEIQKSVGALDENGADKIADDAAAGLEAPAAESDDAGAMESVAIAADAGGATEDEVVDEVEAAAAAADEGDSADIGEERPGKRAGRQRAAAE